MTSIECSTLRELLAYKLSLSEEKSNHSDASSVRALSQARKTDSVQTYHVRGTYLELLALGISVMMLRKCKRSVKRQGFCCSAGTIVIVDKDESGVRREHERTFDQPAMRTKPDESGNRPRFWLRLREESSATLAPEVHTSQAR